VNLAQNLIDINKMEKDNLNFYKDAITISKIPKSELRKNTVDNISHSCIELAYLYKIHNYKHPKASKNKRFVYLFFNETTKLTKIGISNNTYKRINDLQNASGVPLTMVIEIQLQPNLDESAKFIEDFLHNYFDKKRMIGEWFNLSMKEIKSIGKLFWIIEGQNIFDAIDELETT